MLPAGVITGAGQEVCTTESKSSHIAHKLSNQDTLYASTLPSFSIVSVYAISRALFVFVIGHDFSISTDGSTIVTATD